MTKPTGKPNGRPTIYTDELADDICKKIANTSKGLIPLCKENPHWPDRSTIKEWILTKNGFSAKYAKAKMEQADFMAEEMVSIADDSSNDDEIRYNEQGEPYTVVNSEHVARSRLRLDTRKWLASKLAPKVYGERVQLGGTVGLKQEDSIKDLD